MQWHLQNVISLVRQIILLMMCLQELLDQCLIILIHLEDKIDIGIDFLSKRTFHIRPDHLPIYYYS